MAEVHLRQAVLEDAAALDQALSNLSADMGDPYAASAADIARFGFGPAKVFSTIVAEATDGSIVGVAAYSPFFSTVYGQVGIYVSDLWVAKTLRGQQLGVRLLAAVRNAGTRDWDAGFIRLGVYHNNPRAQAFYQRLGFVSCADTDFVMLSGNAFDTLGEN